MKRLKLNLLCTPISSIAMSLSSFSLPISNLLWRTTLTLSFSLYFLYHIANSTIISTSTQKPCSPQDAYKKLNIILHPNGTITRLHPPPLSPPSPNPNLPIPVLSKDLTFNSSQHTWLRIFLPRKALHHSNKLPFVIFFHGGGFVFLSAATSMFHNFCLNMADDLSAVVASVEYLLAPEHRLPAAYDDALDALHWIQTHPDRWLTQYADFSECYLMGSSAGGNIAYHAGLRAAAEVDHHLKLLKIRGLILVQPFFGGVQRTESEIRLMNNPSLPLCVTDLLWELSLPIGVDRDHEYCNPTAGDGPERLGKIQRLGWRVLVTGCGGDPLVDRQMEVVKMMKEKDIKVVGHFTEGDSHGIQDRNPLKAKELYGVVKNFLSFLASNAS